MKHLPLVWAGLWCKPARTIFTMAGIIIAFLLFGLLQGVDSAFSQALERGRFDRLLVNPRLDQPVPLSYKERIAKVPGVKRITEIAFLPGYYQDPKNGVLAVATNPEIWLAIRPEIHVPEEQIEAVTKIRTGALISDWLAKNHRLKIGDPFTVHTAIPTLSGTVDWTFEVVGIMGNTESVQNTSILLANFEYYEEGHAGSRGTASRFLVRIDDPRHTARIINEIDQLFTNSSVQTQTQSEREAFASQVAEIGDVSFFTRSIIQAVFLTLLILTCNTMMESVRERTSEFAVLKTLGFSRSNVIVLILGEALLLCVSASLIGLALAAAAFPLAKDYVGTAILPPIAIGLGCAFAVGLAIVSAMIPAWQLMRLKVIDALAMR